MFEYENLEVLGPDGRRSHAHRRILVAEAVIVARIFAMCAAGTGYTRIAKSLNAEQAPSPRPQQGRPAGWAPSSVREILHRELYRGVIVWNKTRKRDRWEQHRQTDRPKTEWMRRQAPELRIVSEALCRAARARSPVVRRLMTQSPPPHVAHRRSASTWQTCLRANRGGDQETSNGPTFCRGSPAALGRLLAGTVAMPFLKEG